MYSRSLTVTKVEYSMSSWSVELENGLFKNYCKYKPPYVVGDTISEIGIYLNYMQRLNHIPHFEWEKKQRQKISYY